MTPFMLRVAEIVGETDTGEHAEVAPMPTTRISRRIATGTGADRHVAIRSLVEQLVCEANAVLGRGRGHLDLHDETWSNELAFRVRYEELAARVSMTFENGVAYGRLLGDGFESELPQELEGPESLPDLLVRLIIEAGASRRSLAS